MKFCVGSTDEPLYEFLHINTVTVDYYGRVPDILYLRLDQPTIQDSVLLHRVKQNFTCTEKAVPLKSLP